MIARFSAVLFALLALEFSARASFSYALLVGGGPNVRYNQAGIETHLRFVSGLFPNPAQKLVLFANGDPRTPSVLYYDATKLTRGERILNTLFPDNPPWPRAKQREPQITADFAPSTRPKLAAAFGKLQTMLKKTPGNTLLYFTGHGGENDTDQNNNNYDFWGGDRFSVHDLAAQIATLPQGAPVAVVMVQCYAGAFGNLIFANGDPHSPLANREIAGFFATTKDREAEGCTADINEANYQDFSSYFFGALCGHNRLGKKISGADYNGDGHIGMNEAFCYALIHEPGTDVPICTSDIFLRRYVEIPASRVYKTAYAKILAAATPAQRAALDGLSTQLGLTGDKRLLEAYTIFFMTPNGVGVRINYDFMTAENHYADLRLAALKKIQSRWPALHKRNPKYRKALTTAAAVLTREAENSRWQKLLQASVDFTKAENRRDLANARLLRFLRLCNSVVRAKKLAESDNAPAKAAYARLCKAEAEEL